MTVGELSTASALIKKEGLQDLHHVQVEERVHPALSKAKSIKLESRVKTRNYRMKFTLCPMN
jgi:hypothetical protein